MNQNLPKGRLIRLNRVGLPEAQRQEQPPGSHGEEWERFSVCSLIWPHALANCPGSAAADISHQAAIHLSGPYRYSFSK